MRANAEHLVAVYTSRADDRHALGWPTSVRARAEVRWDRIRQNRQHASPWEYVCKVCSAVFFCGELRIVRFFPGFRALQFDTVRVQDRTQCLDAD